MSRCVLLVENTDCLFKSFKMLKLEDIGRSSKVWHTLNPYRSLFIFKNDTLDSMYLMMCSSVCVIR